MGFTAIADAGKLLEETWKGVHDGEVTMTPSLGRGLANLAAGLQAAVDADPAPGPPALAEALRSAPAGRRERGRRRQGRRLPVPPARWRTPTWDGLLGSIDSWAFGENVRVNAASLFRLINEVCSLRVDAGALAGPGRRGDRLSGRRRRHRLRPGPAGRLGGRRREDAGGSAEPRPGPGLQPAERDHQHLPATGALPGAQGREGDPLRTGGRPPRRGPPGPRWPFRPAAPAAGQRRGARSGDRLPSGSPPARLPPATLSLRAMVDQHRLRLVVEDDGRGVDWEAVRTAPSGAGCCPPAPPRASDLKALHALLFSPGFTTALPSETGRRRQRPGEGGRRRRVAAGQRDPGVRTGAGHPGDHHGAHVTLAPRRGAGAGRRGRSGASRRSRCSTRCRCLGGSGRRAACRYLAGSAAAAGVLRRGGGPAGERSRRPG